MFVFDRGYASQDMMTYIEEELQSKFLFRLRDKLNLRIDALPKPDSSDGIVDHGVSALFFTGSLYDLLSRQN